MAVESTMLALGTPLPPFSLPDTVGGRVVSSSELAGKPSLVAMLCNHCPYVKHVRASVAELGRWCAERGVAMVGISSNDVVTHPQDGPDAMAVEAREGGYGFPYLFDETQDVARAFQAACTPEFYVFDAAGKLAYRGQLDGSRPKNSVPVTGGDVKAALEAVLAGRAPSPVQKPSIGCSIKWKAPAPA